MKLCFKILGSDSYSLDVDESDTVARLKNKIYEKTDRVDEDMFLILRGKILKNDNQLLSTIDGVWTHLFLPSFLYISS